jgi:hypothetical protein
MNLNTNYHDRKTKFLWCAMKSCITDGGRPFGDGLQEQLPNHPELHRLVAVVVSVREKTFLREGQVWVIGGERK